VPLNVVYAGTPEFAVPALEALCAAPFVVSAVLTQPDRPAGRGRALSASAVKRRALELELPVLQPPTLRDPDALASLAALKPDVLVVAAYGLLLPPAVLALAPHGGVNLHASLLPRWRGAAPVQRALLAGDAETGVAIMQMESGLDTGPVYATERVAIEARDTGASLTLRLARVGARLLVATLRALEQGGAHATPQPAAGVVYAAKLDKAEASIDWRQSAVELDRQVRAFVPWPIAATRWRGAALKVHEALPVDGAAAAAGTITGADASGVTVATGKGSLRLLRVQLAGRTVVNAAEFARAAAHDGALLGARFDSAA